MTTVRPVGRTVVRRSALFSLAAFLFLSPRLFATPPVSRAVQVSPTITTVAGNGTYGDSGDGGAATSAQLKAPLRVAVDAAGNLYIADSLSNRIRKVDTTGKITTIAGNGSPGYTGDGGLATSATFNDPEGVAVDAAGNVYISDTRNHAIRKVDTTGKITTIAGNGSAGYSVDPGPAASAQLNNPVGLAFDLHGNLYIADYFNNRVRMIDTAGNIATVAGNSNTAGFGGDNGPATAALLSTPVDVMVDPLGNLYISDLGNHRVRKVSGGVITTIAGNGSPNGSSNIGDGGPATAAIIGTPQGLALDPAGNLYISDLGANRVREVDSFGIITTIAGTGLSGATGDGGPASLATFGGPYGIAVNSKGTLFIADQGNSSVRSFSSDVTTATFATTPGHQSTVMKVAVQLNQAMAVKSINVSSDYASGQSAEFSVGQITGCTLDGSTVNSSGTTCLVTVTFTPQYPGHRTAPLIVTDGSSNLYTVGFAGNATGSILAYSPSVALTIPSSAFTVGLSNPVGLTFDNTNSLYVADNSNARVLKIRSFSSSTVVNTGAILTPDPMGVATDAQGNLYIVNYSSPGVIKVTPGGTATTISVSVGGTALSAASGIAATDNGSLYVADKGHNRIVKITPQGVASALSTGSVSLNSPEGVALDDSGNVFIADTFNNRVVKVALDGTASVLSTGSITLGQTGAIAVDSVGNVFISDVINKKVIQITVDGTASFVNPGSISIAGNYGLAVAKSGVLSVSNSTNNSIGYIALTSAPTLTFSNTTIGQTSSDSPSTVAVQNIGNASLLFTTPSTGTNPSYPTGFPVNANALQLCSGGATLNPGNICNVSVNFRPTVVGSNSGQVTLTDDMFNGASSTQTISVSGTGTQAVAILTGPTQPISVKLGQAATITVNVAAQSGTSGLPVPTGTVSYQIGSGSVQQAQLTNGQATLQIPSTLAVGSYTVTATYLGDANYLAITTPVSIQFTVVNPVAPDFSLTANPTVLTIQAGASGTANFTLTPVGGFTGTVTFSCSGLPQRASCGFAPANLTADGSNTAQTTTLTVATQRASAITQRTAAAGFLLPGALLGGLLFWQRRRFNLRKAHVLMLVLAAAAAAGMVGCGGSSSQSNPPPSNQSTSTVTVTATASGGTISHTATFTLNVTN